MRKLYAVVLLITAVSNAQSFVWLQTPEINLAINPDLAGYCVAADNVGNIYAAGFKDNAYPYNDIFGDVFFNKYDTTGQLVFSKVFTGRIAVYAMDVDAEGNVFMDIGYVNTATIGSLVLSTTNQGIQPLLLKFDSDGNVLWHYVPAIPGSIETRFRTLSVGQGGSVYIGLDNFMDSFIEKISSDGFHQMTISQTGTHLLNSIDVDTEGNIYAAGSCADADSTFAGVMMPTTFSYNDWIVKYSPAGAYQWMQYVEDITCSLPQVRASTPQNVYFSSDLYGPFAFGNIVAEGPTQGLTNDFFLAKLNETGQFQWVKEVPGAGVVDHGTRNYLATELNGNVVYVGKTRLVINWGNGFATTAQGFSNDALVLKFDAAGNMLMAKTAGGASEDRFDSAMVTNSGEIVVAGMGRGNGSFDSLTHQGESVTPYAFVGKISAPALGIDDGHSQSVAVWPNPVSDYLMISNLSDNQKAIVFNILGQQVMDTDIAPGQPIDVRTLPSGCYLLKTEGNRAARFVKK